MNKGVLVYFPPDRLYYLRIENAEGYVLIAIYLFVCVLHA